jgi:hypothetical protein
VTQARVHNAIVEHATMWIAMWIELSNHFLPNRLHVFTLRNPHLHLILSLIVQIAQCVPPLQPNSFIENIS